MRRSAASAIMCVISTGVAFAGPITPPPGPVGSTHKTLTDVEPRIAVNAVNTPGDASNSYRITEPGSYYLAGNLLGESGKNGIEIVVSGVTLDLNGFDVVGVAGSFDGVKLSTFNNTSNVTVMNGSVRSWGQAGVSMLAVPGRGYRVIDVQANDNGSIGIEVANDSMVIRSSATRNTTTGISVGSNALVSECVSRENGSAGISVGNACVVRACVANDNISHGIISGSGGTITECTTYSNSGNGISTASAAGCTISRCTSNANVLNGIRVTEDSHVRDNTCDGNGAGGDGAGIWVTGTDNRIEGNNCSDADFGIDVDGPGNWIVRNTCSGNTLDWTIAPNNVFGPIVDRRVPSSGAISGFSGASSLGSTDANANYSY